MNETTLPNFADLDQVLQSTSLKMHPSEAHGLLVGWICARVDIATQKEKTFHKTKSKKVQQFINELQAHSVKQLEEFLFEFQLLLPDDQAPLADRAEGLTLWCQGFLTGIYLVQNELKSLKSQDTLDALKDILEIAQLNYDQVVADEEDEAAFVELVEYVRMATILIYQELQEFFNNNKSHLH